MLELSIAISIVDMASEEAARHGAERVDVVRLKLGRLSGVVPRALLTSFELACEQTRLEGSRLEIEDVPVVIYCPRCQANTEVESIYSIACAFCGTPGAEVVQGREIEVVALELSA